MLANPVVAAEALTHPGILGKILDAAEASFGNALHAGLTVAGVILLVGAGSRCSPRAASRSPTRADADAIRRTASSISAPDVPKLSRAKPRPVLAERGPGAERDPAALEERLRGIVAEPERAAVEPGEVARLRRHVADRRQVLGEQLGRAAARLRSRWPTSASSHSPPCSNAAIEREHAEVAGVDGGVVGSSPASRSCISPDAGHDHGALEPGEVPRLEAERDRDPVLGRLLADREVRDVRRARQRHRRVDLVGDHDTPYRAASAATASSSSRASDAPVGLWGLQSR